MRPHRDLRFRLATLAIALGSYACSSSPALQPIEPGPPVTPPPAASSALAAAPATPVPAAQPEQPKDRYADVRSYLQGLVDQKKIAGAVALIERDGKVELSEALGMRDVEAGAPMTKDTIFRICSMSKPVTSVGVMLLVEEKRIALTDPVSKYIPAFKRVQVAEKPADGAPPGAVKTTKLAREITIQDLLSQQSGLTYTFLADDATSKRYQDAGISDGLVETPGTMGDNVARLAKVPLVHQPGAAWTYSLSVDVLGNVIEVVSGKTLAEFLDTRIFKPLKMSDTGFRVPPASEGRLAAVYQPKQDQTIERLPKGTVKRGKVTYSASYPLDRASKFYSGGAGLVSTASDYTRFAQMLLNGGKLDGVSIFNKETLELMTRDHTNGLKPPISDFGDGFGLGFGVVTPANKDPQLGSEGTFSWGGFYNTYFWVEPKRKLTAVVLTQLYPSDHLNLPKEFRVRVHAALDK